MYCNTYVCHLAEHMEPRLQATVCSSCAGHWRIHRWPHQTPKVKNEYHFPQWPRLQQMDLTSKIYTTNHEFDFLRGKL